MNDDSCTVCGNVKRDDGTCPTCTGARRIAFTISLFDGVGHTRPRMAQRTWPQLCAKFAAPVIRHEKDGLLFSPAKYRAPRRLIANVIELSLLVLEVDGAWKCDGCGHKAPLVMFRNARHENDRCPRCKKLKVPEPHSISQIEFDLETLIADVRAAFHSAFAIYSTHGHKRVTGTNPLAEPRYRIVVPLDSPVPVGDFPALWELAVAALHVVPADPQVKDPNRIYYTPVKFSASAPYEFHIEPGEFFKWRPLLDGDRVPVFRSEVDEAGQVGFRWHEDRHVELCARIMARAGKQNSRGHYDAQCLAHGGKGKTALCYFPRTCAVTCNKGCTYPELLRAEGLSDEHLPSTARAALVQARSASRIDWNAPPIDARAVLTIYELHNIYAALLGHCFELTTTDEAAIRRQWSSDPFWRGVEVQPLAGVSYEVGKVKICSMPSPLEATRAANRLAEAFDVNEVPGFYTDLAVPGEPSAQSEQRRWLTKEFGIWRIYLPFKTGLLVPYDNGTGCIVGIRVYRNVRDSNPVLLSSRGLPCGGRAIPIREAVAA